MSALKKLTQQLSTSTTINDINEAQRLFHGRGHQFPGLEHVNIDWLPPVILIILYQTEDQQNIRELSDALMKLFPECRSIQVQFRNLRDGPVQLIRGEAIQNFPIMEQGLQFRILLGKARNKGSINIETDYPKIIRRLPDLMATKASLLLCMNSPHHGPKLIVDTMSTLAPDYHFIEEIKPPSVYQDAQSKGVKALYFQQSDI